jgi:hypothetical protein
MPDEPRRTRSLGAVRRGVTFRAQTNRQRWLTVLSAEIRTGMAAIVIPAIRGSLGWLAVSPFLAVWLGTESRRSREQRAALSLRLAALPPGDVPADIVSLIAAGKKIQAIKRYRLLTGARLTDAKAYIDGL